jgi:hypothetical protein
VVVETPTSSLVRTLTEAEVILVGGRRTYDHDRREGERVSYVEAVKGRTLRANHSTNDVASINC